MEDKTFMDLSTDWLQQTRADLELAKVSAAAGHHEWDCISATGSRRGATASRPGGHRVENG
jgi:hypothetical protein